MALRTHEDAMHKGEPFKCSQCAQCYSTISRLNQHIESHSPINSEFTCNICNKQYRGRYTLLIHHRYVHKPRTIACTEPNCTAMFKTQNSLRMHRLTHIADEPNYACTHCEKTFKLERGVCSFFTQLLIICRSSKSYENTSHRTKVHLSAMR